jgi:pullulanase/glycogen debranching enzyme
MREEWQRRRQKATGTKDDQEPVLSQVKLIAEPWDLGEGWYQVGNFPVLWTEWNGKYRDTVRRFWRGDGGTVSELGLRLAGGNDLHASSGRKPYASIHGDEIGRTQQGNNNAYCQDNELVWMDWNLTDAQKALFEFTADLIRFRLSQPVLLRRKYFQGRSIRGGEVKDVAWLAADGHEMDDAAWNADFVRSLGMLLSGDAIEQVDEWGEPITGDTLLVLLNAHNDQVPFTLPPLDADHRWQCVFDTVEPQVTERLLKAGGQYPLQGRSVAVLKVSPPIRERRRRSEAAQAAVTAPVEKVLALTGAGIDGHRDSRHATRRDRPQAWCLSGG